ncbi:hypothetical protein [Mycobacterium bourgelatii]|nr:hypothetical protein [Mycobacterium bourgelatii]MCV6976281.1 hypothetical protein [Mycobacterium bourgelatii]
MAGQEGGRWDVGVKDNEVYIARIDDSDQKVFNDLISPDEARGLADLLTKYADKAGGSEESDESDDHSDKSDKSEKSDDDDGDDDDDEDEDDDDEDDDDD